MSKSKRASKQQKRQQKFIWISIASIVIIVFAGILYVTNKPGTATLPAEISVSQAYQEYQKGTFFLDVRTPEEWNDYHIPNTMLIPLDELPSRVNELPKDAPIVVVCRSGNRSQVGRDILLQAGFENVTSMSGGVNAWRSAGYPTE